MADGYALLQLLDAYIAIPDSFGLILETDVALCRTILHISFAEIKILNKFIKCRQKLEEG